MATARSGDSLVRCSCILFLLFLVLLPTKFARAQSTAPAINHLRVYLVTFGPGSDPWEKFGHDCIVIEDEADQSSLAYNWGVFSFGEGISGFVSFGVQFLRGRLMYSMQSNQTGPLIEYYKASGRSVLVQELEMTPAQKSALQNRLIANDTEANRYYLYDYFKKNCATMCRDEIDLAVNGQIMPVLTAIPTDTTYRWHDQRLTADCLWLYLFLDYALGHPVDLPLTEWDESFLPGKFAGYLRSVRVLNEAGVRVPLVKWEKMLSAGTITERAEPPKKFFYDFLIVGLVAGSGLGGIAYLGIRHPFPRWVFLVIAMVWSFVAGLMGTLMTYAWFSDHIAAKWNENWLNANPLSLLLCLLLPMYWRWPRTTRWIAYIVLTLGALDLAAKLTPSGWQVNGNILALTLPIHTAMAIGITLLLNDHKSSSKNSAGQRRLSPASA